MGIGLYEKGKRYTKRKEWEPKNVEAMKINRKNDMIRIRRIQRVRGKKGDNEKEPVRDRKRIYSQRV